MVAKGALKVVGDEKSYGGLRVTTAIEAGDDPAKGCDPGPDTRRRFGDRKPDKAARVASPSYDPSPSEEGRAGPRLLYSPGLWVIPGFRGSREVFKKGTTLWIVRKLGIARL